VQPPKAKQIESDSKQSGNIDGYVLQVITTLLKKNGYNLRLIIA
jgi:hypothetical protein